MTRAERRRKAKALDKKNYSLRAIAREIGVHHETVNRDLHPVSCPRCGTEGMSPRSKHCRKCQDELRGAPVHDRALLIESLWKGGETLKEIGDRFGWKIPRTGNEIRRLREKGYDLPYRRQAEKPKFKKQVVAK